MNKEAKRLTQGREGARAQKMKRQVQNLPYIGVLVLLFLVGCGSAGPERRGEPGVQPTPVPTTAAAQRPTYTVARGDVVYEVQFPARVTSANEELLAFTIDGQVKAVYAGRNDRVQAGDVLADLDTAALESALFQAVTEQQIAAARLEAVQNELGSQRRRAEIAVELAQLDVDFARQQAGEAPTAEQSYQIGRLELQLELAELELGRLAETADPGLQADVDAADLLITELEEQISQAQLVAPFDGQILSLNISPGERVEANETVGLIADPDQLEVSATLPANRVEELVQGMAAEMTTPREPGLNYLGLIRELPVSAAGSNSAEGTVHVSFEDPEQAAEFELGDRLTVHILVESHTDALWLPPAAIRDFNGRKFVVVQDGEFQRRTDITLGLVGEERVEIVAGVLEGEVIVGP